MKLSVLVFLCSSIALANPYTKLIRKEALRQGVDPKIAIAVAKTESGLNPKAVGKKGEIGLFQILERDPSKKQALFNPKTNIRIGVSYLKYWSVKCPIADKKLFYLCFNNGFRKPKHPTLLPYYKRVSAALLEVQK